MGSIRFERDGGQWTLPAHCLIGRTARCDIRLEDRRVSGEHASLHWLDDRWELRDLGSRNGTYIDGKQLRAGDRVTLRENVALGIGAEETALVLIDASGPIPLARHVDRGETRLMQYDVIALPDDDHPVAVVRADPNGGWLLESADDVVSVHDQQIVPLASGPWRLELPVRYEETWLADEAAPVLGSIKLRFAVSRDEEHVELSYRHGGNDHAIPSRAHHYMLLTLARLRLADAELPPPERGWIERERLCGMLGYDQYKLNVEIHRVRRQLSQIGIKSASRIIERRSPAAQLRIGTEQVSVSSL